MSIPCRRVVIALGFCLLFMPRAGLADSDGYFCSNERYLAYQFNGMSKNTQGQHVLALVYLDDAEGPIGTDEIRLEMFQVHGMHCGLDAIEVLSFDHLYRIDLSQGRQAYQPVKRALEGEAPAVRNSDKYRGSSERNLGGWYRGRNAAPSGVGSPNILPLSPSDRTFRYELHIYAYTVSEVNKQGGFAGLINTYIHAMVVKKAGPSVIDLHEINTSVAVETVD